MSDQTATIIVEPRTITLHGTPSDPDVTITITDPGDHVLLQQSATIRATGSRGPKGDKGDTGPGGAIELFDSVTPPVSPGSYPYLRFERDLDGDVQYIYLGTLT